MKRRHYKFPETFGLDGALQRLAMYEVTGGLMVVPTEMEEVVRLQKAVADKFNEFKKRIQIGSCDFEFIRDHVLGTYGAFPHEDNLNMSSTVEDMILKGSEIQDFEDNESKIQQELEGRILNIIGRVFTDDLGELGEQMPNSEGASKFIKFDNPNATDDVIDVDKKKSRKFPPKKTKLTDNTDRIDLEFDKLDELNEDDDKPKKKPRKNQSEQQD